MLSYYAPLLTLRSVHQTSEFVLFLPLFNFTIVGESTMVDVMSDIFEFLSIRMCGDEGPQNPT